ncbi:MAG: XRE family transcriptional regulator [Acetobacteraceae bacterium]
MTLDQYLTDRGMTLEAFAGQLGEAIGERVYVSTVWKWRRGKAVPRPRVILAIEELTENQVTARDIIAVCAANEPAAA